ncbi:GerAB/ArcD/ProY family transporter [Paenibacillus sp. LMG 31461]|uniref:GerAB/ArcD/ProY family transporter n=1 Tax=Paenibacillus plantarum TaxID=2654975 RepID=A0ABX1XDU6_9BACL|nr:GerAB/ArcD/ProY family transporter [Paenibacillus plantarum]NOU66128.1 GerAB/ArcD/ProY family transporter [Paenibacillus plantarum]
MITKTNRIGTFQLYCIVIQAQFGSAIISIAHAVTAKSGSDAWISCLVGGMVNSLFTYLIWKLACQSPKSTVMQMLIRRLGGISGRFILAIMAVFYAFIAYVILMNWIYTTKLWAYARTPNWFLLLALISICFYLTRQPIRVYARFATFATFFMIFFIVFAAYLLKDWNPYYVLPVFESGPLAILDGSLVVQWALMGVEILLLLPQYVDHMNMRKVLRITMYANWTTTLFYAFCVFSSTALFGKDMIAIIREPLLYQMKAIEFNVVERIDLIIISIWILFIITSFYSYLMLFVSSISAMFKQQQDAPLLITIICSILLFAVSMYAVSADQLDRIHKMIDRLASAVSFGLVTCTLLLLWFVNVFQKNGGKNSKP